MLLPSLVAQTTVTIGYEVVMALVGFFVAVAPIAYFLGRLTQRVATNESNIQMLYAKVDEMHRWLKAIADK